MGGVHELMLGKHLALLLVHQKGSVGASYLTLLFGGFQDDQDSAPEELGASWEDELYPQGRTGQNDLGHLWKTEVCLEQRGLCSGVVCEVNVKGW